MSNCLKERTVTLVLTANCNLHCSYCYEKHAKNRMTFETAKNILDSEFSKQNDDFIYIDFFGGEPFLEFNLIKSIYEYVIDNYLDRRWIMFATTNGTLIHGEIKEWLNTVKSNFVCGLSLDGTKMMHDINRSNSFDQIDLDFFTTTYPFQPIKMTISAQTLPYLSDGVIFCHEKGFEVNCNLAYGIDWSDKSNATLLNRELYKLINYYLNNPQIKPCSLLDFPFDQLGYEPNETTTSKWCGAGIYMHTYDTDGTCYPCQFFLPISVGDKFDKVHTISFKQEIDITEIDKKCQTCVIREACPTCYGSNFVSFGNIYQKDEDLCLLTKYTLLARSYFKTMQLKKGLLDLNETEKQALIRSILVIQNAFPDLN